MSEETGSGKLSDVLKKLLNSGLTSVGVLNEEVLKGLPKEIIGQLVQNAKNTKDDLMKSVSQGVCDYLEKVNFHKEVENILDNYEVQMNMKFSLKKKNKKESDDPEIIDEN